MVKLKNSLKLISIFPVLLLIINISLGAYVLESATIGGSCSIGETCNNANLIQNTCCICANAAFNEPVEDGVLLIPNVRCYDEGESEAVSWAEGTKGYVYDSCCTGFLCGLAGLQSYVTYYDPDDDRWVRCNGPIEEGYYAKTRTNLKMPLWVDACGDPPNFPAGDGKCEYACGANLMCDEESEGWYCEVANPGVMVNCTDCDYGRYCKSGASGCSMTASLECDYKLPGDPCTVIGPPSYEGICNGECQCEIDCPECYENCDTSDPDCETNICTNESHCGGCGQSCSAGGTHINNSGECTNGWCTCDSSYYRYGACTPESQYSYVPPDCTDNSIWNTCLTPYSSTFDGAAIVPYSGSGSASAFCGAHGVDYVAKKQFYQNDNDEWIPEYLIYNCNFNSPTNQDFSMRAGESYIVYPKISVAGSTGAFSIDLYPGENLISWSSGTNLPVDEIEDHLTTIRSYEICGQ